jgi:hypothetical protein
MKMALEEIAHNISTYGYHVYLVSEDAAPRFAYTIGLLDSFGAELVVAGCGVFKAKEVKRLLDQIAELLRHGASSDSRLDLGDLGSFRLRAACADWVGALLLGAADYYRAREIRAFQVVPDEDHWSIDVADLSRPWTVEFEPVWRWYFEDWPFPVPRASVAATNLNALRGQVMTRATRWEEDLWEIFAGSDVSRETLRVVPLGVLIGADDSLRAAVDLRLGEGLQRDENGIWRRSARKQPKED